MAYVNDFPSVRLKSLTEAGAFQKAAWSTTSKWSRDKVSWRIEVNWFAETSRVTLVWDAGCQSGVDRVDVVSNRTRFGVRRFFVCPITGIKCTAIYLVKGRFGCRQAFGLTHRRHNDSSRVGRLADRLNAIGDRLTGRDGRGPARGQNRDRLLYRLEYLDFQCRAFFGFSPLDQFYPELRDASSLTHEIDKELKKRDRRSQRENGLDTAAAYDRALVSYAGSGEETLRRAEIGLRDIASPNTPDGPLSEPILAEKQGINRLPIAIFEDHARLDIRVLAHRGLFRPHEVTPLLLDWGDTAAEVDGVHGFIDLSDLDEAFLAFEYVCQGELSYQKIRLEYCGNGRPGWRVVCPATGREGHVLVFRAGRFASRQAQRLVNRSQRVSKTSKASSESLQGVAA